MAELILNMLPIRESLHPQEHMQANSEGMEKDIVCKQKPKRAEVTIVISDKLFFK